MIPWNEIQDEQSPPAIPYDPVGAHVERLLRIHPRNPSTRRSDPNRNQASLHCNQNSDSLSLAYGNRDSNPNGNNDTHRDPTARGLRAG